MLDAAELLQGRWIWRETWRWVVAAERRLELHWIGVECAVREWKARGLQVEAVSHTVLVHRELWESLQAAAAHLMMFWSEQQRGTGKMSKVWLAVSSLPSSSEAPFCDSLGMRVAAHSGTAYKLTWCWWGEPNSYLIPPVCQAGHRLCPSSSFGPAVRTGKPVALIEKVVSLPSVHGGRRKNVGKQWDKNSEITCCHFCLNLKWREPVRQCQDSLPSQELALTKHRARKQTHDGTRPHENLRWAALSRPVIPAPSLLGSVSEISHQTCWWLHAGQWLSSGHLQCGAELLWEPIPGCQHSEEPLSHCINHPCTDNG